MEEHSKCTDKKTNWKKIKVGDQYTQTPLMEENYFRSIWGNSFDKIKRSNNSKFVDILKHRSL